jgi:hypothetical protein
MPHDSRLRAAIAFEAARLMYERHESEYFTAKRKAAKRLCRGQAKPEDLPSNSEIRDQVQAMARMHEGERRLADLAAMRLAALGLMRQLREFRPRLIGSVLTGHVRKGSDIDLHVFTDAPALIAGRLESEGHVYDTEHKQVVKHGESRVFTHIHVYAAHTYELTVYPADKAHYVFKSSITGKAIERASIAELEQVIAREHPDADLSEEGLSLSESAPCGDPYPHFRALLAPLEQVTQSPIWHPEGDVLYHLLQVFELARDARAWDEEFLQAALLHDVGKGIDRLDHVAAGLRALDGFITERTAFLIAEHMTAHEYYAGSLSPKERRRLEANPDFEELMLLEELDRAGREPGRPVGTLDEALDYLRQLAADNEG